MSDVSSIDMRTIADDGAGRTYDLFCVSLERWVCFIPMGRVMEYLASISDLLAVYCSVSMVFVDWGGAID